MDSLHEPNGRRSPGMHATLSVLEALVTRAPLSLTDLAAGLEAPKSSVYRVCTVLVERGWLVRNPDGRYDLGIRAFGLSPRSSDFPLVRAFRGIAANAVLAALTICLPTSRIDPARQKRLTGELRDAGQLLSSAVPWLAAWNSVRAEARQLVPAG